MTKKRRPIPERRVVELPPSDYQPRRAELEEEFDMPGMDIETFFRPFKFQRTVKARRRTDDAD